MPSLIEDNPYKRYKAVECVLQTSLEAKAIVTRRDNPNERYVMVIVPTSIVHKDENNHLKSSINGIVGNEEHVIDHITNLLELSHPNIVQVYEAYKYHGYCYCIMEDWASHRQTRGIGLLSLTEAEVASTIQHLASAVHYMHQEDVIHGNLAYEDICFFRDANRGGDLNVKLIDLGTSRHADPQGYAKNNHQGGRHSFWKFGNPPEAYSKQEYTKQGDVWSVGAIAYRLLTGDLYSHQLMDRLSQSMGALEHLDDDDNVSREAKDFVHQCLQLDPHKRMTSKEMLNHAWFSKKSMEMTATKSKEEKEALAVVKENILENLNKAEKETEFKRLACQVVASHWINSNNNDDNNDQKDENNDNLKAYQDMFEYLDPNHLGYISHKEFVAGLSKQGVPDEDLSTLFLHLDSHHSGRLAYNEFLGLVMQFQQETAKSHLMEAFHNMDADNDGYISQQDLMTSMDLGEDEAQDMLQKVVSLQESFMNVVGSGTREPKINQAQFIRLLTDKPHAWPNLLGHRAHHHRNEKDTTAAKNMQKSFTSLLNKSLTQLSFEQALPLANP